MLANVLIAFSTATKNRGQNAYFNTLNLKIVFILRRRLHDETRIDSSRDEFIPATVYMTGETRRVEISSRDEISSHPFNEMHIANVIPEIS